VQVPTTLLAAVDSSVGGKTAIDLPAGKNLCGAFYQPKLVLCDTDALNTLPEDIFRDGCAEVIKYGILYDPQLFAHLEKHGLAFDREYVITRCVELKKAVVMEDEFDTGNRQMLNFGHTIGHAIEALSEYQISHGKAVAIGMSIVAVASAKQKTCTQHTAQSILSLLKLFDLPTKTSYSAEQLKECALSDKKRTGSTITLIIPEEIGKCRIHSTPISQLQSFIEAGLT
jgi:3-dehydroquinate synthase